MHNAEKAGKSMVATEKALDSISKDSEEVFMEAMGKQKPPDETDMKLVDVTHTMFAKAEQESLPESTISIYKGLIANLMSWGRKTYDGKLCGIMAGDGESVTDCVVCTDFDKCIQSDTLSSRMDDLGVHPMGLVVWIKGKEPSIEQFSPLLQALESLFDPIILMVMSGGNDPCIWEVSISQDGDVKYQRCSGAKSESGRKKKEKYRVVDFQALGKNTTNNMSDVLASLLKKSVKEKVTGKVKKVSGDDKHELEVQFTPADGYCFWHSMLGCLDFDNWKAVPRKDSGYSINSRLVKEEEDKTRALATMVMATATKNGADTARIADISKTGCLYVH